MILITREQLQKYRDMKKAGVIEPSVKPREFLKLIGVTPNEQHRNGSIYTVNRNPIPQSRSL